ncbi:MAG: rhomboid family intramembrane serine protease [Desulfobacteraceae bacterium]|nr:rhomboid family intramembrane serine protease [Desulfobacteraceae bacterium]
MFAHLGTELFRTYSLVLSSSAIAFRAYVQESGWCIEVPVHQRREALRAVRLYLQENPPKRAAKPQPKMEHPGSTSAIFAALILLSVQLAVATEPHPQDLMAAFGADAGKILNGELYRCVTALLLHHGWPHLTANAVAVLLFGTFAVRLYGWGMAWLLMLLCGALGNYLAAVWYGGLHLSVGASTAIFGGVGLCAAAAFWRQLKSETQPWRAWLPLAAGLALVGWLGTGPQADLVAHMTGFLSGLLIGGLWGWKVKRLPSGRVQTAAVGIVAGVVLGSWFWGYLTG